MPSTNLAISTDILWKVVESRGHDPRTLFLEVGLDPDRAHDPNARISSSRIEQLQVRAAELLRDPCVGLYAVQFWHPSHLGPLGYAWLASSTLRAALGRLQRFIKMVTGIMVIRIEDTAEGLAVSFVAKPGYLDLPHRHDFFAALVVHMCRMNFGDTLTPARVSFMHAPFPGSQAFDDYFRCRVTFAAPTNTVVFAAEDVDKRLPSGNPQLAHLHDQVIIRYIAGLDRDDIVQRAKAVILDQLQTGVLADDNVAEALHLSVRTLQRKLRDVGTSFRELLEQTRREVAEAYIRDRSVSLGEVAFMLGFSDASAFSRAYRRWTGKTPTESRAN